MASACSGQAALRPLPSPSTSKRTVSSYATPSKLKVVERRTMKDSATAGIDILKVTKYGKLQPRRIALSADNRSIYVTTNRIKSFRGLMNRSQGKEATARGIDVSMIDRIHRGQQTKRFILARAEEPMVIKEEPSSLSIVYHVSSDHSIMEGLSHPKVRVPNRFDTLDLVVPNEADFKTLVSVLEDLLSLWSEERKRYDRDTLLLEHHWLDMGKELPETLSAGEWITLCDKLNMPLKKSHLSQFYKDFLRELDVDELTMDETGELVNDMRAASLHMIGLKEEDDPLTNIWNEIVETDPVPVTKMMPTKKDNHLELEIDSEEPEQTVSAVAFLSFIRSQQKEYKTQLEHVLDRFYILKNQITMEGDEKDLDESSAQRLNMSNFFAYMMSDTNDIMDPLKGTMTQNKMFQPLSHYWINTSHDTYLAKLPSSFHSKANREALEEGPYMLDSQSYRMALYRGVRCLELDTWDGETVKEPVVSRRPELVGDRLFPAFPFSDVLLIVRDFLETNPDSFPIILNIENHCSLKFQEIMAVKLDEILGSANLLYTPRATDIMNGNKPLPTPENLRGLVVVKSKRPKDIKEGATVLNDDFDDENDVSAAEPSTSRETAQEDSYDDDEDKVGSVIGFDASGPIMSNAADEYSRHPLDLLNDASREEVEASHEADKVAARAAELRKEAAEAEILAAKLLGNIGMTPDDLKEKGLLSQTPRDGDNVPKPPREEGTEVDLQSFRKLNVSDKDGKVDSEGLEVQEFFADSVSRAKWSFTEADADALEAAERAAEALKMLNKAKTALSDAEVALEESHIMAAKTSEAARRAATEARANREHADTAKQRVETVRSLLHSCKESASSSETVVVTAVAEAKISEQRASETEARASRALEIADKDRARADEETRKEVILEKEAAAALAECREAEQEAKDARDRMEKAVAMLDRVNEQIKLIETSTQYQKEKQEAYEQKHDDSESRPHHKSRFLSKHAAKLEERDVCMTLIKEAKADSTLAEVRKQRSQGVYDGKARLWKAQNDVATTARRKADRSSHTAEELAEHAEEEREAANLRHVAREKAKTSVAQRVGQRTSVQEQLAEAERASAEAVSLSVESRKRAEQLAKDALAAKDHTRERQNVEEKNKAKEEALKLYELAVADKDEADCRAADAKRLLDTSSEVLTNAKREAISEIHRANAERLAQRTAAHAYDKALLTRQQAEQALVLADMAKEKAAEKAAAARHAREYRDKMAQVAHMSKTLACQTLLHSTKYKSWVKSLTLPSTHMHSFSQGMVINMKEKEWITNCIDFTMNHLCRTFPSWEATQHMPSLNFDPVVQWSMGIQLVSMNSISADEQLLLNDGRFRENGSCGYVLKPEHLIDDTMEQIPEQEELWRFQVLSGSCIPKPESRMGHKSVPVVGGFSHTASPFVKVSLHDGIQETETSKLVHETKEARRNGLNPVWNSGNFDFLVASPSIAMVLFSVWEKRQDGTDDFIAAASVPVSCIREGYRSVPLFDSMHTRCGPYAFASLFVQVQKMKIA